MTVDRTDPYAALGLTPQATQGQIRRAYRTLLRQHHPDTRGRSDPTDNALSDTTLQQVLAAYAILGDPVRRAGFDHHTGPHPTSIATGLRHRAPFPRNPPPDPPPIQAGPVRWHRVDGKGRVLRVLG